jgi:hypothetical protein
LVAADHLTFLAYQSRLDSLSLYRDQLDLDENAAGPGTCVPGSALA